MTTRLVLCSPGTYGFYIRLFCPPLFLCGIEYGLRDSPGTCIFAMHLSSPIIQMTILLCSSGALVDVPGKHGLLTQSQGITDKVIFFVFGSTFIFGRFSFTALSITYSRKNHACGTKEDIRWIDVYRYLEDSISETDIKWGNSS
jgi:hypothetical protein